MRTRRPRGPRQGRGAGCARGVPGGCTAAAAVWGLDNWLCGETKSVAQPRSALPPGDTAVPAASRGSGRRLRGALRTPGPRARGVALGGPRDCPPPRPPRVRPRARRGPSEARPRPGSRRAARAPPVPRPPGPKVTPPLRGAKLKSCSFD